MANSKQPNLASSVREAIGLLGPCEARIVLARAINRLAKPKAGKSICALCELAIQDDQATAPGYAKKLRPATLHAECARAYHDHVMAERTTEIVDPGKFDLKHCACGGLPEDHASDEMDNLLKCSHCSDCDHFRYAMPEESSEAEAA